MISLALIFLACMNLSRAQSAAPTSAQIAAPTEYIVAINATTTFDMVSTAATDPACDGATKTCLDNLLLDCVKETDMKLYAYCACTSRQKGAGSCLNGPTAACGQQINDVTNTYCQAAAFFQAHSFAPAQQLTTSSRLQDVVLTSTLLAGGNNSQSVGNSSSRSSDSATTTLATSSVGSVITQPGFSSSSVNTDDNLKIQGNTSDAVINRFRQTFLILVAIGLL